ncbi:MAG: exonuclease SbcCD subunit D [Clostridia bacterium]|nr:exonuclease SbcCD subunit D [Clostridia bacterium]
MKFIHTADLHLDSKIENLPPEKANMRREEILRSFERLCDYAKQNHVSAVIIAGDLFDTRRVTKKALERVIGAISLCDHVDFLYLAGNHDGKVDEEIFNNFPDNFKLFSHGFSSFRYGGVVIGGFCYEGNLLKSSYDQIVFNEKDYNVLCMHGQIADYKNKQASGVISIPLLKDKFIDYLALGHYHSYSTGELDARGVYAYSGCLDARGFDEIGQKGFVLLDTDKNTTEFIEFSSRIYYESEFNVSGFDAWFMARSDILSLATKNFDKGCLLKLVIKGDRKADFNLDINELQERLNEIVFFARVDDKTDLILSQEDYLNDKSVRGEFLRLVWESDLSPEQKKKVISCGLNAIKGEEIL